MSKTISKNDDVRSPYQKAKSAWDERIGSARVQAYNWRAMAFILSLNSALRT